MTEFIHAQLTFHARAMELYTAAYQQTQNIREDEIVEVGVEKNDDLRAKQTLILCTQNWNLLNLLFKPLLHAHTHTRRTIRVCILDSHRTRAPEAARLVHSPSPATRRDRRLSHWTLLVQTSLMKTQHLMATSVSLTMMSNSIIHTN